MNQASFEHDYMEFNIREPFQQISLDQLVAPWAAERHFS